MKTFTIYDLIDKRDILDESIKVFWTTWGNKNNFRFYEDTILNSCKIENTLPRFYIALMDNRIIGTYALLMDDFSSRQDLFPWFACLWINPDFRGNNFGMILQKHAIQESLRFGYKNLYLCKDLNGYYEKSDWTFLSNAYLISGETTKIYSIKID